MRSPRDLLAVLGGWPRRLAALACLILAAGTALGSRHASGADGARTPVAVARHALAAGTTLTASDVRIVRWPSGLVPSGAANQVADLAGHRIAGPLERGEAVLASDLLGPGLTRGLGASQVALPVTVGDPLAGELIHPGDQVDLLAGRASPVPGGNAAAVVVARGALVLAVFTQHADATHEAGTELVVATSHDAAARLATLSGSSILAVVDKPA